MPGSNVLLAQPGVLQGPEGAELIEWMKAHAFIVLSQRVILGNAALTHDTRDELRLRHTLLLHDRGRHEMPGSHVLLAQPGVLQGPEGAELIERMKAHAFIVLSQRVILGNVALTHDTRDELRLRHTLLLHEKLQGAIASSAR